MLIYRNHYVRNTKWKYSKKQKKKKKNLLLTKAAIWKGIESFKRSYTLMVTSFPYTAPNKEITSLSRSFKSGSLNNDESNMSASREGGDDGFSNGGGGLELATTFPFPLVPEATPWEGRSLTPFNNSYPSSRLGGRTTLLSRYSGGLSNLLRPRILE